MLEEEKRLAYQVKWENKRTTPPPQPVSAIIYPLNSNSKHTVHNNFTSNSHSHQQKRPTIAFGSCLPRLLDNHIDGNLWKSQYNLNVTREPGMRASSAQDLHLHPSKWI